MTENKPLKDIDWRTRQERQREAIPQIKRWYDESVRRGDERTTRALTSVLWLLMDEREYDAWVTDDTLDKRNIQELRLENWYEELK